VATPAAGFKWKLRLVIEILQTYVLVRIALSRRSLPDTLIRLRTSEQPAHEAETYEERLLGLRLGGAVSRSLSWLPFDSRCLVRSLVLARLLARRGIRAHVVIGVRSEPDFAAHAWVESGTVPLLPTHESEYERLVVL
jgi:hypothetical protein